MGASLTAPQGPRRSGAGLEAFGCGNRSATRHEGALLKEQGAAVFYRKLLLFFLRVADPDASFCDGKAGNDQIVGAVHPEPAGGTVAEICGMKLDGRGVARLQNATHLLQKLAALRKEKYRQPTISSLGLAASTTTVRQASSLTWPLKLVTSVRAARHPGQIHDRLLLLL